MLVTDDEPGCCMRFFVFKKLPPLNETKLCLLKPSQLVCNQWLHQHNYTRCNHRLHQYNYTRASFHFDKEYSDFAPDRTDFHYRISLDFEKGWTQIS